MKDEKIVREVCGLRRERQKMSRKTRRMRKERDNIEYILAWSMEYRDEGERWREREEREACAQSQ